MKCLIVDDDELSREIHKKILSSVFDCSVARNGIEAVEMFKDASVSDEPYDLICMDVEMPVCNGHESLALIRKYEKEMSVSAGKCAKVIMLSSHDDPKTVLETYLKGGTSYLVKPVNEQKLMQVLKTLKILTS